MNDMRLPATATAASHIAPLAFEAVSVTHRGQPLLQPLTLRLTGCRRTLVMGPNGAGKSLLLHLAHGLLAPSAGAVRWEGEPPRQAMVFQRPVLLRRSALDNLTYALAVSGVARGERRERAREALARFGLSALEKRPARVLSGGEQQRLALARAWLTRPEVLFLDEPTSALDPAAIRAVEAAVLDFHLRGTRIVMTTHDLNQAHRLADEVVLLYGGRLIEHTPAERFFTDPQTAEGRAFLGGELVW
ncbi:ATP-binding cassette domain-containing protein [uncultured Halomonas sp.]|uniref:ATP-binding cassette domain-containing protein n=1 Tax=uncultured Halomonas sp. TaxID=173971 RepID=UPI00262E61CB|nr:ATP-binding cassette domain-containing protein [uncultured Halomonas sp.]